jgi:hypothetical protein
MDKQHFQMRLEKPQEYNHYNRHFVASLDSTLDGIIAFSGSEMETDFIFGELMTLCQPWCEANNKKIYVMSPSQLHHCKYPNAEYPHVEHVEWHGYDMINYGEINEFNKSKNTLFQNPSKLFVCYNNTIRLHRTLLINQLEAHDLLEKGVVTYKLHRPDLVDEKDFELYAKPEYGINHFPRSYFKGLIDIVTESRYLPGEHYLSEKTFKPLIGLKPFLVLSAQGYHTWLERKGIKKYNIFDYSFDNEPKLEDRVEGIIQNLKRLDALYKTPEDYANVLKELEPDMQHNLDAYTNNIKNGQFLCNPILDYLKLHDFYKSNNLGGILEGESQTYFYHLHTVILSK